MNFTKNLSFLKPAGKPGDAEFDRSVHHIMDVLAIQNQSIFAPRRDLFDMASAEIDPLTYSLTWRPYGVESPAEMKGRPFYEEIFTTMIGRRMGRGINYSIEVINPEYAEEKIATASKEAANTILAGALKDMAAQIGMPPAALLNTHPDGLGEAERTPLQKIMDNLKDREQFEVAARILLDDCLISNKADLKLNVQAYYDLLASMVAVGRVEVSGKQVRFSMYPIENFTYIGGETTYIGKDPIMTDFDSCDAIGFNDWLMPAQIVAKYPQYLSRYKGDLEQFFQDAITGSGVFYTAFGMEELPTTAYQPLEEAFGYPENIYVQPLSTSLSPTARRLRLQTAYIRFMTTAKFECINSKGKRDPEVAAAVKSGKSVPFDAYYVPYKGDGSPDYVAELPFVEVYECVRVGRMIIHLDKAPIQPRISGSPNEVIYPAFGIIFPRQFAIPSVCRDLFDVYQRAWFLVDKYINLSGGKAVIYDVSKQIDGTEINDIVGDAKAGGVLLINSAQNQQSTGQNDQTWKHLQTIDLSQMIDVTSAFNLAFQARQAAKAMLGLSAAPVSDQTMNAKQAQQVGVSAQEKFYLGILNHLQSEAVKRLLAFGKFAWADGTKTRLLVGKDGAKLIERYKEIALSDWATYVTPSSDDAETSDFLRLIAERGAATGNGSLSELITLFKYRDNPNAMEAILEDFAKTARELASQQQQTSPEEIKLAIAQLKASTDQAIESLRAQTALRIKDKDIEFRTQKLATDTQFKEDRQDIIEENRSINKAADFEQQARIEAMRRNEQ